MAMFGLIGKTITLLWQLWLFFGPSYQKMRIALLRIRALVLDFGTESGFPNVRDLLPAFCEWIGVELPNNYVIQPFLFPRALLQPGWRHSVERLIKRTCLALDWFPGFMDGLKAVVSFVRDRRSDICQALIKSGFPAVADLVGNTTLKPFREWRWGTLKSVSRQVLIFIHSLVQCLDLEPFRRRAQDPSLIRRIAKAFAREEW